MRTPHKHAEAIKAWADGATIQRKEPNGWWACTAPPCWAATVEYRVKPEPVRYRSALIKSASGDSYYVHTVTEGVADHGDLSKCPSFIRWLGDWQEVEES